MYIYQCKGCPYLNPKDFKCMYTGWPVEEVGSYDCYMEEKEDIPDQCHKCKYIDLMSLTCKVTDNKICEDVGYNECLYMRRQNMRINIHAGHNPDGKVGCGAVGIMGESTMNRQVVAELKTLLESAGHIVYDCTVNDGKNARDVLEKIVAKCNAHEADLDISIHHNACVHDFEGDGKTTGTEIYVYSMGSKILKYANSVLSNICKLGYRKNQGVIARPELYVLKHTKAPAMLVECCFCDDKDDINLWNPYNMALAIAKGIDPVFEGLPENEPRVPAYHWYKVQTGAFKSKYTAEIALQELKNAGYTDAFIQEY